MTTLVLSFLNRLYSFLKIRRTTIKAWMSLNSVKIPSPIMELTAKMIDNVVTPLGPSHPR